ncbi:MAG TPA: VapE domain-containing protein [Xanthobacteraceae bacterium]|nr:VapE domain-containing protein [Xanthobacteraceae bacterium]
MSTAEEMEAGRKRSEYFANLGNSRPQLKSNPTGEDSGVAPRITNGANNVIPIGPTGNTGAHGGGATLAATGPTRNAGPTGNTATHGGGGTGPMGNTGPTANTGPTGTQDGPNAPKFDHAMALEFYSAVGLNAFILGFVQGRSITSGEEFQALTKEADDKHEHLFFHVSTLTSAWADPKAHKKGKITTASKEHVLECPYLWGDCDAEKYTGNDPVEAAKHYENEGLRVKSAIDAGLLALGIAPSAIWRSGAGWQFLIKLDHPIKSDEAETLVGKLHTALGFDPVVRNPNRILRVPGSVNWKDRYDGRVPSPCTSLNLIDHAPVTKVDDVRKALANVAEPDKAAKAGGASKITIDWSKVKRPGWLKSVADLPDDAPARLKHIIGHDGNLRELNENLIQLGMLKKGYGSWSDVTHAIAAAFKFYGKYTPEQIAEALSADLPCNQHIAKQKDQQRAIERAISRSHSPTQVATAGVTFRDFDKYGNPRSSLANAVIAVRALGIKISYDLFHRRINVTYNGDSKTIHEGLLTDDTASAIRSLVNNTYRIDCGDANTLAAIKEIAFTNAYDPVLDILDDYQSRWDGVKRLDTWVIRYLGCSDTKFNRAIGRATLIAACHRARNPGCKFDTITVLEGVEGTNKSTAIRVLAGDANFSDQSILGAKDKEVQEQLDGVWMHENADLAGMRRAEVEQIKAFASRQIDRARPAYGRVREDRPRRSIEWGTTNNKEYLLSQTGNRRFWPLETGKIDIGALMRDRQQLLGEAATYEAAGASISLDPSLWSDAREAQEQRRVTDPWEDVLTSLGPLVLHKSGDGYERVASADLLEHVLEIPRAQQTSAHGQRLAHAMERLGWTRNKGGRVTIDGKPVRGYIRSIYGSSIGQHPAGPSGQMPFEIARQLCDAALGITGPPPPSVSTGFE